MFECTVDWCNREFETKRGRSIHESTGHDEDWKDPETLRDLYWNEGLSLRQIAERLDTNLDRVSYAFDAFGLETRASNTDLGYAPYRIDKDGYELWKTYVDGMHQRVRVHRLLAVAEYGFDAVAGNDVHHENGVRWDNRPSNISVMDPSEHRRHHGLERADEQRELMNELRASGALAGGGGA